MNDLPGLYAFIWSALADGVAQRSAPCRTGALATVGDGGEARMIVLRRCDAALGEIELHSDTEARKVAQLRDDPRATLLFWLPDSQVQIRLRANFDILTGPSVDPQWEKIPPGPRQAYGGMPPPGAALEQPSDHDTTPQRDRFAVLIGRVTEIDTLHLGDPHRRALFARSDGFKGTWIAP